MHEYENDAIVQEKQKLKRPKMYKVIFHNDDYTTMEFVVYVLETIFHKPVQEAVHLMLKVHLQGSAVVGVYTYEIASTGIGRVQELAEKFEYPFLCTMEEL